MSSFQPASSSGGGGYEDEEEHFEADGLANNVQGEILGQVSTSFFNCVPACIYALGI